MLNRANLRKTIFHKSAIFDTFEKILDDALDQFEIDRFAYCLMPNHDHLLVRLRANGTIDRFGQYIGLTHTQRYHAQYHNTGQGHLYQGRYKSFPVQTDEYFSTVTEPEQKKANLYDFCIATVRSPHG